VTYSTPALQQIAEALSGQVASVLTANGVDMNAFAYLSDRLPVPVCMAAVDTVEYHLAAGTIAGGGATYMFTLHIIVARSSEAAALEAMESYMDVVSPASVAVAVETPDASGARALGGVVMDVLVKKSGPPAALSIGTSGAEYIVVPFEVQVIA
jgi:hypothetical protein